KSKSVPRALMEGGFEEIMQQLQPAKGLFDVAKAMLRDAWDIRLGQTKAKGEALRQQLRDTDRQIENLLDRVVEASSASVVSAYEKRIDKLEREKFVLSDRLANLVPPTGRLEECIELALGFLSNPWILYKN